MSLRKQWMLCALMAMLILLGYGLAGLVHARITGTPPTNADVWCVGPGSYEACVDSAGNLVPTTTNNQTSGSSSLRWSNVYTTLLNVSGATTQSGALGVAGTLSATGAGGAAVTYGITGGSLTVSGVKGYITGGSSVTTTGRFFGPLAASYVDTGILGSGVTLAGSQVISGILGSGVTFNTAQLGGNLNASVINAGTLGTTVLKISGATYDVWRCVTPGVLGTGALTVDSTMCGTSAKTGLVVP